MPKKSTINQMKYDKEHRRVYGFRLHNEIDKAIIDKLASVPSMQGYIKQLILDDIARTPFKDEKVKCYIDGKRDVPTDSEIVSTLFSIAEKNGLTDLLLEEINKHRES